MKIRTNAAKAGLIVWALMLTLFILAGSARTAGVSDYENHSLILVPQLSSADLTSFQQGGFDVVRVLPEGDMEVVAASRDRDVLIDRYGGRIAIENMEEYYRARLAPDKAMGGYHTYDEMVAELTALEAANPGLAHLEVIGYTYENRPMYAFKISDNVEIDEDEPEVQFNGMVHAREPMGLEICMTTLNYLLDNQTDPDIADLINTTEIWFVPCMNPDGYVYNETTNPYGGGMWRKNRRDNGDGSYGIDLNRNWGFKWAAYPNSVSDPSSLLYHGTGPFSEPETEVMRQFIDAHEFVAIVNYHSYGNIFLTPFGVANVVGCPDNSIFDTYVFIYANMTAYNYGLIGGPTGFGGDAACWQYAEQFEKPKAFGYLIETATDFWPSVAEMEDHCQRHLTANLKLIEEVHELVNHSSLWLSTDLTAVDSVITDCAEDFTKTFTFHNNHESTAILVNMNFSNLSPGISGWVTPHLYSGLINPGESIEISFDLSPSTMFGMANGAYARGDLQLVLYSQDSLNTIDVLDFWVMMGYQADYDDGDSYIACADNCPLIANEDQADFDGDGVGDVCDNCPETANSDQGDYDFDGVGDLCDMCPGYNDAIDGDSDDIPNSCDNCPETANTDQSDEDQDGIGDLCDICSGFDDAVDTDADGVPDGCDICAGFDDAVDADADGVPDGCDNCPDLANPDQADIDENGVGDACQAVCGDANGDREPNVGDAVYMINFVFKSGPAPDPLCSGDANGDGESNVGDAVYLINFVFKSGPPPVETCCAGF